MYNVSKFKNLVKLLVLYIEYVENGLFYVSALRVLEALFTTESDLIGCAARNMFNWMNCFASWNGSSESMFKLVYFGELLHVHILHN